MKTNFQAWPSTARARDVAPTYVWFSFTTGTFIAFITCHSFTYPPDRLLQLCQDFTACEQHSSVRVWNVRFQPHLRIHRKYRPFALPSFPPLPSVHLTGCRGGINYPCHFLSQSKISSVKYVLSLSLGVNAIWMRNDYCPALYLDVSLSLSHWRTWLHQYCMGT